MFVSVHRAPGMTPEEFAQNGPDVLAGKHATMHRVLVNMPHGFIVTLYEGESAEAVENEFERLGFPYDEVYEVQLDVTREMLEGMVAGGH